MRLDSHQHFWVYDEAHYPWIPKGSALHRDWLPNDLAPLLASAGMDGCIAVQARQTLEESRWLLTLADHSPLIKAVVGWIELRSERVEEELAELAADARFRGVRHIAQDEPDDRFLLRPDVLRGIGKLAQFGLTYDILVYPRQLPAAIELAAKFPSQPFVLDHLAKPLIKTGTMEPWRTQIRELAKAPNVMCKASGMITEADHQSWRDEDLRPYLDVAFEAFGPGRMMFGSDWPVCLLAGRYERVFGVVDAYTRQLGETERTAFFGGNAARFYGISPGA